MQVYLLLTICTLCAVVKSIDAADNIKDWWQTSLVYQIYPRSFLDTDDDGVGDLRGITTRMPYLSETGISSIWLSPIYQSPMIDFGYDISNYRTIHYEYGSMDDFYELMGEAGRYGIRVILDLVPNHSSDQHEWFLRSAARDPQYEDYYVWSDGKLDTFGVPQRPNNWLSVFGGPAWTWHPDRGQFYFHQFTKEQPDLNYRNPKVVQEMEDIMQFWLEKGVSGFRVDAVNHMFEVENVYQDEEESGMEDDPTKYGSLKHELTADLVSK